jgi:subtilisin family serine protease
MSDHDGSDEVITMRGMRSSGKGDVSNMIQGILHIPNDASIVNMSGGAHGKSEALEQAIREVIDANRKDFGVETIFVVSAGNDATDASNKSPGRMTEREVITVGATDMFDRRLFSSNYGPRLDLFAPGEHIKSAGIGSDTDHKYASGTSVAAPHVAGAIALRLLEGSAGNVLARASMGRVIDDPALGSPNRLLFVGSTLASLSLGPPTVIGGCDAATGDIRLEAPAPIDGAVLTVNGSIRQLLA